MFATSARATNRMTVVNGRDRIVIDLRRHVVCGTEIVRDINLKSVPSDEARWPGRIFKTGPDTPFCAVLMTVDLKRPVRWFFEPDALKKYEAHVKMGTSVMAGVARQVHPIVYECDEWRWIEYLKYADVWRLAAAHEEVLLQAHDMIVRDSDTAPV